jgi:hypothetical protein
VSTTTNILDRFLEPLTEVFTPELARKLASLRADDELQARVNELAEKANHGVLSAEEDREYKRYIEVADIIGVMQSKARRFLTQNPP